MKEEKEKTNEELTDWRNWQHFNAQLKPCSYCRRTFFPHRLPIHEKSCKGTGVKKYTKTSPESKGNGKTNNSQKFLECQTCGRKYNITSLTLHELKCRTNTKRLSTGEHSNIYFNN